MYSFSPSPQFSAIPLPQINYHNSFFSPSNFWQQHCHKSIATIFFFLSFRQFYCHKSIATIFFPSIFGQIFFFFFPSFSETSLPKLLLNFSPRFWQLGCHSSLFFFLLIFGNLVATILIFSLLTPLQFRQLGCHN